MEIEGRERGGSNPRVEGRRRRISKRKRGKSVRDSVAAMARCVLAWHYRGLAGWRSTRRGAWRQCSVHIVGREGLPAGAFIIEAAAEKAYIARVRAASWRCAHRWRRQRACRLVRGAST